MLTSYKNSLWKNMIYTTNCQTLKKIHTLIISDSHFRKLFDELNEMRAKRLALKDELYGMLKD